MTAPVLCIRCRQPMTGVPCAACYPPPPAQPTYYLRLPEWQRLLEELGIAGSKEHS